MWSPHCYSRVRLLAIFPISSCSNRCPGVRVSVLSFWTHNMNTLCRLFALLFVRFNVTKTDIPWHHTPKWSVRFMAVGSLLVSVGDRHGKQKFVHIWARCFQLVINESPRGKTKERWTEYQGLPSFPQFIILVESPGYDVKNWQYYGSENRRNLGMLIIAQPYLRGHYTGLPAAP
jgi:hypothetical protein